MEKKLVFSLVCCFLLLPFSFLYAQTEEAEEEPSIKKGKVLLGTYFNLSISKLDKTRVGRPSTSSDIIDAGINLTGGQMLSDHWGYVVILGYAKVSSETPVNLGPNQLFFKDEAENYSIAAGMRYYSLISDATYFFIQGGIQYNRGNTSTDEWNPATSSIETVKLKTRGITVGISPGVSYFMTKKLSTEISIGLLGYSVLSGEDESGNSTEIRSFHSLLYLNSVSLGFVYYL